VGTRALRVFGREGKECAADLPNRETAEALKAWAADVGLGEVSSKSTRNKVHFH
jgi:hypothetical protein